MPGKCVGDSYTCARAASVGFAVASWAAIGVGVGVIVGDEDALDGRAVWGKALGVAVGAGDALDGGDVFGAAVGFAVGAEVNNNTKIIHT